MRYIAVEREDLRELLHEDGSLADLLLSTFIRRREASRSARASGSRSSAAGLDATRGWSTGRAGPTSPRLGATGRTPRRRPRASRGSTRTSIPLVRFPGGAELRAPSHGELRAPSASASSSIRARRSTCWWSAAGRPASAPRSTAPPRGSTRWWSRAPCSAGRRARRGGSRTTSASRLGSAAPS